MKFLIVGCGSIGKRHIGNLRLLGAGELLAYDTATERREEVREKFGAQTFDSFEKALGQKPDVALICTPTSLHVRYALAAAQAGCHLFIEKPISDVMEGVDELIATASSRKLKVLVGCNFRFHWGLVLARRLLNEGRIGRLLYARAEFGQYLPDWHPWEDYRQGYSARRELGGGIILDSIHEIDYIHWLIGKMDTVSCLARKLSSLDIDTEDTAELLLLSQSGIIASIHMDYTRRDYNRRCELVGEAGTITWSFQDNLVRLYSAKDKSWQSFTPPGNYDVNDMYVAEMKHFLNYLRGNEDPALGAEEARDELRIVLAAKKSSESGTAVNLLESR